MVIRLAFSVAIASSPDIMLIDEVIGVGDADFHQRSLEKIREFQRQGKTILFASHSAELVRDFCQHALWLDHGRVVAQGDAREIMDAYKGSVAAGHPR